MQFILHVEALHLMENPIHLFKSFQMQMLTWAKIIPLVLTLFSSFIIALLIESSGNGKSLIMLKIFSLLRLEILEQSLDKIPSNLQQIRVRLMRYQ